MKLQLKWIGTFFVLTGILLTNLNIYPSNIFFHGFGVVLWTFHGYFNKDNAIRFGMGAIKGVGASAVNAIVSERKKNGSYKSIFDLSKRVDLRAANKKAFDRENVNILIHLCLKSILIFLAQGK